MIPTVGIVNLIAEGFEFLRGVVSNVQLRNLMMIATAVVLQSQLNLSAISRGWLHKRSVNAFSWCLSHAKIEVDELAHAYAKMLQQSYQLAGGRFIIDDTLEHHSKLCRFIHGVAKHFDHVFDTTLSAKCLVFLYYAEGALIKFPLGWRIYYKDGEKTKNELAIELIDEALGRGFRCQVVLADSWFCVEPFLRALRHRGLRYVVELKRSATVRIPIPRTPQLKRRGRPRKKWYTTVNITEYMSQESSSRVIGFRGDLENGREEQSLYEVTERIGVPNALPWKHKIVLSRDPKKQTAKYLITNELSWEALKVVTEYFRRWTIEEFFRNAKQQLNMEGACVRSEQGVALTLFLLTCIDSLFHRTIAERVSGDSHAEPITVQSVVRLAVVENAERFVKVVRSPDGRQFLDRWIEQLHREAIRNRKVNSEVDYLEETLESCEELSDVA